MVAVEIMERMPSSKGIRYLKLYQSGEVLSRSEAIQAKCCQCRSMYVDGLNDCEKYDCPLYGFMPYGKNRMNYYRRKKSGK
jgi:hypothetical protein